MTAPLDKLNAQFNRVLMSHYDFNEAQEYLRELQELPSEARVALKRALLTAAVVAYCRPFSGNDNHPKATSHLAVKFGEWFKPAQIALHEKLLDLRGKAVAHSDYDAKPVARIGSVPIGFAYFSGYRDLLQQDLDIVEWLDMCNRLSAHCLQSASARNRDIVEITGHTPIP
jgi:hypothetical protein